MHTVTRAMEAVSAVKMRKTQEARLMVVRMLARHFLYLRGFQDVEILVDIL